MKKISIFLAGLALTLPAFAQDNNEGQEPNRLILTNTIGNYQGFIIDRVQDITFGRVEGEVKAEISVSDVSLDKIIVSVTRTPSCYSYKVDVVPAVVADAYDDLALITYIDRNSTSVFYEDYTDAEMTGFQLNPGSAYDIVTVGIDGYGVEDGVCRARIETAPIPVVGDPQVTAEVVDTQLKEFSVKFTPNDDVSEYYCVAGEKGTMEAQYQQFGPMFGFSNFTEMIISWGLAHEGEQTVTWKDMAPNTEYEVFYVAKDKEGNPAPYQVLETSTLALGGDGEASVDIVLGDYVYMDWDGEILPSQFITFTPNDQASCYRYGVYLAENYDADPESIKAALCSDPPMPAVYWFFYEPIMTDFQIDPNTDAVAIAAAKNAKGEWGPVTEVRFTTPEEAEMPEFAPARKAGSYKGGVGTRTKAVKGNASFSHTPGKAPIFPKPAKIELR